MNSRTSWSLARIWLEHCVNNHEECRSLGTADRNLPTRLIDLGPDKEEIKPRICQSAGLSPSIKYMTLSHRWGTGKMVSLTTETIEHWVISMPLSDLPLTFRHAMEATKELGCRYLWIDSLCIIQDSNEDWEREAAMMGDVYQNSHCNLTAAAPNASSTTGLYNIRDPMNIQMPLVEVPNLPLSEQKVGGTRYWFCFDEGIWRYNVVQSPLFKRGWVVQERILSPRILHFAGNQMFWECLERRACETLPVYLPALNNEKKLSIDTLSVAAGPLVPSPFGPSDESLKKLILWESVVERYSSTELTFPDKDKLSALSGIAKKMGIRGEYLAGIWKEGLILHLMWHRKDDSILSRPDHYQAPTWSWASVNGQVQTDDVWPMGDSRLTAEPLDVHIDRFVKDPTGSIRAGWLKIRAPLATITVRNVPSSGPSGYNVAEWNETRESPKIWAHTDMLLDGDMKEVKYHALMITLNHKGSGIWGYEAKGLLLESTGSRGQFHRCGLWAFQTYEADGAGGFQDFLRLFNQVVDVNREGYDYEIQSDEWSVGLSRYGVYIV
jgi:Heterokaryon incompatibility protein (HET)